ncbi:gliding motility-associated protein GldE [Porphyromonas pogonae]|uniref:gliding motility-associated protein GldE n=1 Tax=Porphyromonas pogonae TaxID=867595 RepID=UPI002E79CA45|nr:gliding motility-associated protein GldE [Porphyromonas pogonae]
MDSNIFSQVIVHPFTSGVAIALIITVILLFLSAFMSSSEVAFFSLRPVDIESIKNKEAKVDPILLSLLGDSEKLLATILIGNNIVNVAIVIVTSYAFGLIYDFSNAPLIGFLIQTVVLTLLLLLFGEIIPKIYAQRLPLRFSRFSAPKMQVLSKIFAPLSTALVKSSSVVTKSIGKKKYDISMNDLSEAVDLIQDSTTEGKAMINEIINFYNKTASEIMVPRIDMVDVDISWDFKKMLSFVVNSGYSRIPVYEGSEDNIKGILYVKDLIPHKDQDETFNWSSLVRKAYFVPENKKLDDLLEEFRANRMHISIVVDEYGGTCGIITLEDVLEEILGEISDEYDDEELPYKILPDGSYLFEAKTSLTDVQRILEINSGTFGKFEEEVDTLGGLILEIKQDLPKVGDVVVSGVWKFQVIRIEKHRIIEVKIIPPVPLKKD